MLKYAGELRVGDVWMERPNGRAARTYRVIAIAPGLANREGDRSVCDHRTAITMDFFRVNRVEVEEPT